MKTQIVSSFLCLCAAFQLFSEAPAATKTCVLAGSGKLELNKRAELRFTPSGISVQPYLYSVKWCGFASPEASHKKIADARGDWKYESLLPGATGPVKFITSLACPKNAKSVAYSCSWKPAAAKDIKEAFIYIEIPLEPVSGGKLKINGEDVAVVSEQKFAWFRLKGKPLTLTLFPGDAERELTFKSSKNIRMTCETHKALKRMWIRLYPCAPDGGIELEITANRESVKK